MSPLEKVFSKNIDTGCQMFIVAKRDQFLDFFIADLENAVTFFLKLLFFA